MALRLNLGSGQRKFKAPWINCDLTVRPPGQVPDVQADACALPFASGSADLIVLHHVLEHLGCGDGAGIIRESHRVLGVGGRCLVFTPNLRTLAQRWLRGEIDDYIYCVNLYGAYQGDEADRHRWGFSTDGLVRAIRCVAPWHTVLPFDWRPIEGADIAQDFWIAGVEAVK